MKVKLFIGGQEADIDQKTGLISLVYNISGINDPKSIKGSFSKRSILLPPTKNNASIFAHFHLLGADTLEEQKQQDCTLTFGGIPIFQGKCQLTESGLEQFSKQRRSLGYKVAMFGNNADWFAKIRDIKIQDLDFGFHLFTQANITSGSDNTYTDDTYCYNLIKYGPWSGVTKVGWKDHCPAIWISEIIRQAFESIGYTVDSNFLTGELAKKILPLPKRDYDNDWKIQRTTAAATISSDQGPIGNSTRLTFANEVTDNGNNWNGTTYTAPYSGEYRATAAISEALDDPGNPTGNMFAEIWVNGVQQTTPQLGEYTWTGTLAAGDTIEFYHASTSNVLQAYVVDGKMSVLYTPDWELNTPVELAKLAPKSWTVGPLLLDLVLIYNLKFESNPMTRVVKFEPGDDFRVTNRGVTNQYTGFFLRDGINDITGQVDLAKKANLDSNTTQNKEIVFRWLSDPSDRTVEYIEQRTGESLFEGKYTNSENRYKEGQTVYTTQFFAKTIAIRDFETAHEDNAELLPPLIPLIWSTNYFEDPNKVADETEFAPRILHFEGLRTGGGTLTFSDNSEYTPPVSFFVNYNDQNGKDPSLSFAQESGFSDTINGLLLTYHISAMKRQEVGKVLTEYIKWQPTQIQALTFKDLYIINGAKFILQKIDGYTPTQTKSIKTELQKYEVAVLADKDKVNSSTNPGYIDSNFKTY